MSLYKLDNYDESMIIKLIKRATEFKQGKKISIDKKMANLFFEPSTRTLYSFVSAQMNLGIKYTNFQAETSSVKKGESLFDTVKTFEMLGYDGLVIRSKEDNYFEQLKDISIPIINGGDGSSNHPTQSLLDLMTIYEQFNKFNGLKVTIIGDIKHSRVAHTNVKIMQKLGIDVSISGPDEFLDGSAKVISIDKAVKESDVIMLLRVQHERHSEKNSIEAYNTEFGMNAKRLKEMKNDAIILHPAPFNRGVELTDEVIDSKKSKIWEQMQNGTFIRMAIIEGEFKNGN